MFDRRQFIIGFLAVVVCVGIVTLQNRFYRTPVASNVQVGLEANLVSTGVEKDGIPSIDDPKFESVAAADPYLDDQGFGIVVEAGGRSRFYPYQILVWHEIVNETFAERPLLVTYSPLCGAGLVFERTSNGEARSFGVSGKVYNNCSVLYDRKDGTLVSQIAPGLTPFPSRMMTWREYKTEFPRGQVLSRETGSVRDYTFNPYGDYETSNAILFPLDRDNVSQPAKSPMLDIDGNALQPHYWFSWILVNSL